MHARLAAFAAAALLVTTLPAAAFHERHDHWHVMASPLACFAINRPPEEFNAAPYASLSLRQRRGQPLKLQVFAWPGVFKPGERSEIEIGRGAVTVMPAEAFDSYGVETKDPIPDAALGDMRRERIAQFRVKGLPQLLMFDMAQIDNVLKSLDACARQLKPP